MAEPVSPFSLSRRVLGEEVTFDISQKLHVLLEALLLFFSFSWVF